MYKELAIQFIPQFYIILKAENISFPYQTANNIFGVSVVTTGHLKEDHLINETGHHNCDVLHDFKTKYESATALSQA